MLIAQLDHHVCPESLRLLTDRLNRRKDEPVASDFVLNWILSLNSVKSPLTAKSTPQYDAERLI